LHDRRDPELPAWCRIDGPHLAQVLTHLLSNAVKFTAKGEVSLASAREEGQLVFRVADTGIGMAADQVAMLFRPFEPGDTGLTRRHGGLGIGLALARYLAERMGGTLAVDSRPGAGSTFTLRIPFEPAPPAGESAPLPSPPRPARLLLVVEEDMLREVLVAMLEGFDLRPTVAGSGAEALQRLQQDGQGAYGLVLFSTLLPDMDGYQLAAQIQALAPDLPLVAMDDGFPEPGAGPVPGLAGALGFPLDPMELFNLVERLLRTPN
jgi:anti-sigma regulatory factor (Ser/Thr protein kinase)